jgi:hypothetical protein
MAMKRYLVTLAFCLVFLGLPAQAQDTPTLSSMKISLWPEYDRPEMLVIYQGAFAPGTKLPARVEILIPARVGQPTAVAYLDESGQRFNQQYTTRVEDDWVVVSFELAMAGFQLEYYDGLPVASTGQRTYTFAYTADYPVDALSLEFQVPPTAEAFTLDPPADSVIQEADGLTYDLVQAGCLTAGEARTWKLAYQKADSALTTQNPTPAPDVLPAGQGTDGSTVLIFLVAFVALVAVGATAFWLGRRTQPVAEETLPPSPRYKRREGEDGWTDAQRHRRRFSSVGGQEPFFCPQCGTELRSDSEFCHRCGTAVRGK